MKAVYSFDGALWSALQEFWNPSDLCCLLLPFTNIDKDSEKFYRISRLRALIIGLMGYVDPSVFDTEAPYPHYEAGILKSLYLTLECIVQEMEKDEDLKGKCDLKKTWDELWQTAKRSDILH